MSIKCLMNGLEVNYPCSPVCALFGDCVTAFELKKKANVRTNADRIRAMSDEELCDLLDEWWCMGANNDERLSYADERLAWLQQPYGEEDKHEAD